jgi:hypothetical protein
MDSSGAQKEPIEGVLNELRIRVETCCISIRGLSNLSKPGRNPSRQGRSPSPLLPTERSEITGENGLDIAHHALHFRARASLLPNAGGHRPEREQRGPPGRFTARFDVMR